MKKLFAGIITCVTILLTGIGVFAVAADENNSGNENVQSEIVFVWNGFDECYAGNTDYPPESYNGYFVERNGIVRSFSFEDVNAHWTFGYVSMEDIPKTISLNQTAPQEKLLSHLTDVSKYQIVGKISEEELERNLNLLSDINTNVNIKMCISPLDVVQGYSETFGLRYDDNDNAEVVFLNGVGTIINKHTDENALEIDSWLRNLDISSDNPNTETTQPNPTENTTTTTIVTTTEVKPNTEQETEPITEVPKIEFCQVQFILDYEKYYGIFLDSNRDVYSFAIDNVTENWNLYGAYSDIPIKLTDSMPQDGLLTYLYNHFDEWKFIGKTSEDDYADYKNELNQIDLNTEMTYILYAEPDVIGLSHTETFAVRYDDNGNRQIVFLCGGLDTEYDLYLENPDEHAISLNQKMIQYEKINESATTTTVELNQTNAGTDETTTATNSTTTTTTTSIVATDENKTTASIENITATTETTTTATTHIASDEEFCNWAAKDYEGKTGVMPANAEIEYIAEGNAVITLTDVEGNVLDIYTIDPTTGIGKASDGGTVDLPQTGYSNTYKVIIGFAILMTMGGTVIVAKSRRKRTSHS